MLTEKEVLDWIRERGSVTATDIREKFDYEGISIAGSLLAHGRLWYPFACGCHDSCDTSRFIVVDKKPTGVIESAKLPG